MNQQKIIDALAPGNQTVADLCAATGFSATPVRNALADLKTEGRVRIVRRHVGKTKAQFFTLVK